MPDFWTTPYTQLLTARRAADVTNPALSESLDVYDIALSHMLQLIGATMYDIAFPDAIAVRARVRQPRATSLLLFSAGVCKC